MFILNRYICQINSGIQGWGLNLFRWERVNSPDFTICAIFTFFMIYAFFYWDCTSVWNFRVIGPLFMEILHLKYLGDTSVISKCSLCANLVIKPLTGQVAHYDVTLYWHGWLKSPKLCDVSTMFIYVSHGGFHTRTKQIKYYYFINMYRMYVYIF